MSHGLDFVIRFGGGRNWLEEICIYIYHNLAISSHFKSTDVSQIHLFRTNSINLT